MYLTVWCLGLGLSRAQQIKMTADFGAQNKIINQLLDFQNITIENFKFKGEALKGKVPVIVLKEFEKGEPVKTDTLLNGFNNREYMEIDSSVYTFRFFAELDNENRKFRTWIRHYSYGAGKRQYVLRKDRFGYAMKDFFGNKKELTWDVSEPIPLLAMITPHEQANGWGSYCEVVQADVKPEDLGRHFGIPHYYLITLWFL